MKIKGFYLGAGINRRYFSAQVGRLYCYVYWPTFRVLRTFKPCNIFRGGIEEKEEPEAD